MGTLGVQYSELATKIGHLILSSVDMNFSLLGKNQGSYTVTADGYASSFKFAAVVIAVIPPNECPLKTSLLISITAFAAKGPKISI